MASRKSKLSILNAQRSVSDAFPKHKGTARGGGGEEIGEYSDDETSDKRVARITEAKEILHEYLKIVREPAVPKFAAYNFRVASWGSIDEMYSDQRRIHQMIREAFVGSRAERYPMNPWRSQIILGTWRLGSDLTFDIGIMEPAASTCAMDATHFSQENVHEGRRRINIVQEGSGSNKPVARSVKSGKYRITGRLAPSIVQAYDMNHDVKTNTSISFMALGASAFTCLVRFGDETAVCQFTMKTLSVIARSLYKTCSPTLASHFLKIQDWKDGSDDSSFFRVDSCGVISINGAPRRIRILIEKMRDAIIDVATDVDSCRQFISSLQVLEKF